MRKSSGTKKSKPKAPPITREEILAAREELGMTQEELADSFGVTTMTVSRWESLNTPVAPDAPGAIRMAIEYLKIQRVLDSSELLRSLDQRVAHIKAVRKRIERERKLFSRSKNSAKSGKNGTRS
jgi:DNA-binding transcriptional regulator YiaG